MSQASHGSQISGRPQKEKTMNTPKEKLLVPAIEAAQILSMGRSTFWNKVKQKQLPQPVKVAGITRWRVSDLRDFVEITSRDQQNSTDH
ncbi:helix-turn-helix transcriptional regulator [Variovorax sp. tm]|uniref:helix-turn-helix transcriptional regulator n=1 Tax=Variovorax atrisoli TaxID=3394203 RepID=UPI003A80D510